LPSTNLLCVAISTSISRKERWEAIQKTKEAFSHDIQALHDEELSTGADAALTKHLTFLVWHNKGVVSPQDSSESHDLSDVVAELSMACEALESLFRASSSLVGASFQRMGNELLLLIISVINGELGRRVQAARQSGANPSDSEGENDNDKEEENQQKVESQKSEASPATGDEQQKPSHRRSITPPQQEDAGTLEGDLLLRKATKILGHFARVGSATKPMAHFPGLLGCLINLVTLRPYDCVPWEARLSSLWVIANLACSNENMQMMVCTPGLVASLIEVACRPLHPGDTLETTMEILRSRSIASRAILNLSWAPENKVILATNSALIDLLSELAVHRTAPLARSHTVQDILVTTRRHAIGALRNLAAAPRRVKISLCEYKTGRLFDILTDAALNDNDMAVKHRAFAAIHNLATHDTAETIVNHPALVLALKDVLLSDDYGGAENEEGSPKSHASATLLVLERTITPDMDSYENLKDLLEAINPTPASDDNESDMEPTNEAAV